MNKTITFLLLWSLYVPMAHAQDLGGSQLGDIAGRAGLKNAPLPEIIGNIIKVFIGALGIIFLLLTVYAGFLYLTARGDAKKVDEAKQTLQRGVIGMVIVIAAYAIASFVIQAVTATATTGSGT